MNYGGVTSSKNKKEDPMVKQFISINRRVNLGRSQLNYQQYMDRLDAAVNKNILDNIRPHWRNHASQKGKSLQRPPKRFLPKWAVTAWKGISLYILLNLVN